MKKVTLCMNTVNFVINESELAVAKEHLKEPFPNLFIVKTDDEQVGYELSGNRIIIKFEYIDDERVMIRSELSSEANGYGAFMPRIFGTLCALHGASFIQIGSSVLNVVTKVNGGPDATHFYTLTSENRLVKHSTRGLVFCENTLGHFEAIDVPQIKAIVDTWVSKGLGMVIPDRYKIRVHHNGEPVYYPLSMVFLDPVVAHSFHNEISPDEWETIRNTILTEAGN